jgi:hypothetical protein
MAAFSTAGATWSETASACIDLAPGPVSSVVFAGGALWAAVPRQGLTRVPLASSGVIEPGAAAQLAVEQDGFELSGPSSVSRRTAQSTRSRTLPGVVASGNGAEVVLALSHVDRTRGAVEFMPACATLGALFSALLLRAPFSHLTDFVDAAKLLRLTAADVVQCPTGPGDEANLAHASYLSSRYGIAGCLQLLSCVAFFLLCRRLLYSFSSECSSGLCSALVSFSSANLAPGRDPALRKLLLSRVVLPSAVAQAMPVDADVEGVSLVSMPSLYCV